MHRFTVRRNHRHAVAFDRHLCRTHGRERIDQSETVPATRRNREYLQRGVGHETGVRIAELSASVDQHRFGVLAGVDGQSAGIAFGGVLVQPVTDQHNVRGQIEVVQMRVGITRRRLTHDDAAVQTIDFLQARVRMPEVRARIASPLVSVRLYACAWIMRRKSVGHSRRNHCFSRYALNNDFCNSKTVSPKTFTFNGVPCDVVLTKTDLAMYVCDLPERISLLNRTLRDERHSVVVLRAALVNAVPVNGHLHSLHMVLHIDDNLVVFTHLNARTGDHTVGGENTAFHAISEHALTVRPHRVGGIRCAHLAGTVVFNCE